VPNLDFKWPPMPTPLVSVIVPNYRHAAYLPQRIESILAQTFQDFELILLDDRSPDHSREVLEGYRHHPRVSQLVYNEQNSGSAFRQWNKGVGLAQGRYIWIAESDDWAEPTLLAVLVAKMAQSDDMALAFCQSYLADDQGTAKGTYASTYSPDNYANLEIWSSDFTITGNQFIADWLRRFNFIPNASAVIFRRDLYLQVGGAVDGLKLTGDWLLWLALAHQGQVGFVAAPLNYHRAHGQTVRSDFEALYAREYPQVLAWLRDHLPAAFGLCWRDHLHQLVAKSLNGELAFGPTWRQARTIQPTSRRKLLALLLAKAGPYRFAEHLGHAGFAQLKSGSLRRGLGMVALAATKSRRWGHYLRHSLYWLKARWV
jgi:glycosyltransferase involved in cell wall biosynthesis